MANEFIARNGIFALSNSQVTGSLSVTNGITGSLFGTASWAVSASQALSASWAPSVETFPYTGSARITGSLTITGSLSQGSGSTATGLFAHAEGEIGTASGKSSHVEGYTSQAIGIYSHAEGFNTQARDTGSHAEGYQAIASASLSHAEGNTTLTLGAYSHAEGEFTQTRGQSSHTEGRYTTASGNYSHAEGDTTVAQGYASHTEGVFTHALGDYSHAAGNYTSASGNYQSVIGQYNLPLTTPGAFIIGNGIGTGARSNLLYTSGSQVQVTGSVIATQGFTGSLFGTSSWAVSASWAPATGTAATASTVTITDTTTGTGPYYLMFADGTTGAREVRVDSSTLTYNATTNTLTLPSVSATSGLASPTLNIAGNGATADPYGTAAVTEPADASNYSYYGLTRAGNIGAGFGITGTTGALGLGQNAFWFGTATSGFAGTMAAAYVAFNGSSFVTAGSITGSSFSGAGTGLTGTASSLSIGGNAATATSASFATTSSVASNITVTNTVSGAGPYYVMFADGTTGNRVARVDSGNLTFNSDSNTLTVSNLAGNASTATVAGKITQENTSGTGTYYMMMTQTAVGGDGRSYNTSNQTDPIYYDAATAKLYSKYFVGEHQGNLVGTASWAVSASWAPGGGAAFPFTGSAIITGSLAITGSTTITGSLNVDNTNGPGIVMNTSSIGRLTHLGDRSVDWTGRVLHRSGSQFISVDWGNSELKDISENTVLTWRNGVTGSIFGTASFAISSSRAVTSSFAVTSSNALTASFVTSSNVFGPNGSNSILSASFAISSSRAVTSSFAISSSNALTASFAISSSRAVTSSFAISSSNALTSSFLGSTTNAFIQNGNSFGTTALLGTNDNNPLALETNGTTRMFISSSGDVGIGTASPAVRLDVQTTGTVQTSILGRGSDGNFRLTTRQDVSANTDGSVIGELGIDYTTTRNSAIRFHRGGSTTGGFISFTTDAGSERVRINSTGNVGIQTTDPVDKLDVNGSIRFRLNTPNFTATPNSGVLDFIPTSIFPTDPQIRLAAVGTPTIGASIAFQTGINSGSITERMRITPSGSVGISVTAPDTKLHIEDVTKVLTNNVAGVAQGTLSLVSTDAQAANVGASLVFGGNYINSSNTRIAYAGITGRKDNSSSVNADGYLSFLTWRSTGLTEAMRITPAGRLGINTTAPSRTLDVNGDSRLKGIIVGSTAPGAGQSGGNLTIAQYEPGTGHNVFQFYTISNTDGDNFGQATLEIDPETGTAITQYNSPGTTGSAVTLTQSVLTLAGVGSTIIQHTSNRNNILKGGIDYDAGLNSSQVNGEMAYWGGGSVTAGNVYFYSSTGNWVLADADAAVSSSGMLGIAQATGTASTVGMLLRGQARFTGVTSFTGTTTVGAPLYVSQTAGAFTQTAPTGTGKVVRIIGYVQSTANDQIYFCPDTTWVELV